MGWMGSAHSRAYRQIPDRFPEAGIQTTSHYLRG